MPARERGSIRVADEVWIAAALLHREHGDRADFTVGEIVQRAREEKLTRLLRPGVYVHVVQHCVANRPPNPGRYRILVETGENRRRLYRTGDPYHPARDRGKTKPARTDIAPEYQGLLDWYESEYDRGPAEEGRVDPLLALRGSGREVWADEPADRYIRRLRSGWE
jgi:hypothetical protein